MENPFKIVLDDLKQVELFMGKYDAKNGNEHYMFGISTVMEYIAYKAGDDMFEDVFMYNMIASEKKAEEMEENK